LVVDGDGNEGRGSLAALPLDSERIFANGFE
jgi:hypothetical protein